MLAETFNLWPCMTKSMHLFWNFDKRHTFSMSNDMYPCTIHDQHICPWLVGVNPHELDLTLRDLMYSKHYVLHGLTLMTKQYGLKTSFDVGYISR